MDKARKRRLLLMTKRLRETQRAVANFTGPKHISTEFSELLSSRSRAAHDLKLVVTVDEIAELIELACAGE
jgi:hypothetical protein